MNVPAYTKIAVRITVSWARRFRKLSRHALALELIHIFKRAPPSSLLTGTFLALSLEPLCGGFISKYFELLSARNVSALGPINYDSLARLGSVYQPSIIFANSPLKSMPLDYATLRKLSRQENSHLIVDISSNAGSVVAVRLR